MKKFGLIKILIILTLVIAIIVPLVIFGYQKVQASSNSTEYDELLLKGSKSYKDHLYSKSLNDYSAALELVPSRSEAYLGSLQILLDKSLDEEVKELTEIAQTQLSSGDVSDIWVLIGNHALKSRDFENAVKAFEDAEESSVNDNVKDGLFLSYVGVGRLDDAEGYIRTSSEYYDIWESYKDSSGEEDLYLIVKEAKNLINTGYSWLAIELLSSHKEEMSEYWEGNYFLGKAYFDADQYGDSKEFLERSLLLGADEPGIYLLLSRIYVEDDDLNKAYQYYDSSLSYSSETSLVNDIRYEYVQLLLENGAKTRASEVLAESDDQALNDLRLELLVELSDSEAINALVEEYSEGLENDVEFLKILIEYQISQGNYDISKNYLDILESNISYDPVYYYLLAMYNLSQENPEDSRLNLEKSLEYDLEGEITEQALKEVQKL